MFSESYESRFLSGITSQHQACQETTDRMSDFPPRLKVSVKRELPAPQPRN